MITLPPYIRDSEVYPLLPEEHRWVMNKLVLSEKLGYICGPCGTDAVLGDYCIRPIMNTYGNADGGFYKHTVMDLTLLARRIPNHPGYFYCQWFDGEMMFTEFINDVAMWSQVATTSPSGRNVFSVVDRHIAMPVMLQGISRYMLIESINGFIIEVSCRFMRNSARQEAIDDYKTIEPLYDPSGIEYGLIDGQQRNARPYIQRGFYWEEVQESRRPF